MSDERPWYENIREDVERLEREQAGALTRMADKAQAVLTLLQGMNGQEMLSVLATVTAAVLGRYGRGDVDAEHELIAIFAQAVHSGMHGGHAS